MSSIKLVHHHLVGLSCGALKVRDENEGICTDLKERYGYTPPAEYFRSWRRFSGDDTYPVPGGIEPYRNGTPLWKDKQLKYRLELCAHLAECIRNDPNAKI